MSDNSPTLAFDLARDLRVLSAMASNLTPYLYETELYGYLDSDLPRLTIGGLLLRLYRLSRLENLLDSDQQNLVQDASINFEAECSKWAVHYENKLQHELNARINALDRFLDECVENVQECAADYPSQAEKRTIIEHLREEAAKENVLDEMHQVRIRRTDQKLQRLLRDGEFNTDKRLQSVYPRDKFWWLYGNIIETSP